MSIDTYDPAAITAEGLARVVALSPEIDEIVSYVEAATRAVERAKGTCPNPFNADPHSDLFNALFLIASRARMAQDELMGRGPEGA